MTKKKQPDQRKARIEPYTGKIPNPGQTINDGSADKKKQ